jgi:hypothetical protein
MTAFGFRDGSRTRNAWLACARRAHRILLVCARPFGYLAFVLALAALSATAMLLGDEHELGFFAARLDRAIRRYPELTRRGVQMAWVSWFVLLALALSPLDPIASRWDEVLLVAFAVGLVWRRRFAAPPTWH